MGTPIQAEGHKEIDFKMLDILVKIFALNVLKLYINLLNILLQ